MRGIILFVRAGDFNEFSGNVFSANVGFIQIK